MRYFIAFVVLICASGGLSAPGQPRLLQTNVDKYLDILLGKVDKWIIEQGLDPLKLENVVRSFSVKPIIITYHGEVALRNGHMQGLSQVKRGGNSQLSYEAMFLNLKVPLLLDNVAIDYDYDVKLMDIGPSGALQAKINNLLIFLDITLDTKTLEIVLQDFHIIDTGKIQLKFAGHPVVDWLANAISSVVTGILHDVVQNVIQVQVRQILEKKIQEINDLRPKHGDQSYKLEIIRQLNAIRTPQYYLKYLAQPRKPELNYMTLFFPNLQHPGLDMAFD